MHSYPCSPSLVQLAQVVGRAGLLDDRLHLLGHRLLDVALLAGPAVLAVELAFDPPQHRQRVR
eukprot:5896668-Prymnesium_polylepis.1